MNLRPGHNMTVAVALCAVLSLLCFAWEWAWLLLIPAIAGALVLAYRDYQAIGTGIESLLVSRSLPACVGRGSSFVVSLSITSDCPVEVHGEVRDVIPSEGEPNLWQEQFRLPPNGRATLRYDTRISKRGLYRVGPAWVRVMGSYGMLERQRRFDTVGEIKVLPESAVAGEELLKDIHSDIALLGKWTKSRLRGEGMEFESIRKYTEGDDPRRIDWRSSARHSALMVRRYHLEQHRDLVILLDCGRLMGAAAEKGTKLDRAVDSALMLCRVALAKGDRCGLGVFDNEVLGFLPPQFGERSYRVIMESLYNVQSRWRESDFGPMFATVHRRQTKRSLIVILSDVVDEDTSERFREAVSALKRRHVVLFAALQTPLLGPLLRAPIDSLRDVSRKAVVTRLMRTRERALHSLVRSGVSIIDTEPGRLTVPLVNKYISLRERNLL